jgi:hypothetical protein
MKNAVFWDLVSCGSCYKRRFGGKCRAHLQGRKNPRDRNNVSILTFTSNVVSSSKTLSTLKMEATYSSETLVLIRPTRHHIAEDGSLQMESNTALVTLILACLLPKSPRFLRELGHYCILFFPHIPFHVHYMSINFRST